MRTTCNLFRYGVALRLIAIFLAFVAAPGCGGDQPLVAEGDSLARRKAKEDSLNRMLNPNGAPPASKTKGKSKSISDASKNKAIDEMYLP
jgi:hypothetical protein